MANRKYFGTDGIRGQANQAPMDAETAMKVGRAAGFLFKKGTHRHRVVIGKDTRISGYLIEPALTAGFISVGIDVVLVGPMPTPAVAMTTRSLRADLGVMISASHNTFEDNGIKLFDPNGLKLSDEVERSIEALMHEDPENMTVPPQKLGRAKRLDDAAGRYVEFVKYTFPKKRRLDGLRIVIDCANGAAYRLAPAILWELGAEVIPISVEPNGFNINKECGSTYPDLIREKVKEHRADIGIALDGDADRLIVCDEKGQLVDGDQIMALIAKYWQSKNLLQGGGIVATQMSNLGLEYFLKSSNLKLERTKVGDRYVVEAMRNKGYNLGGEQSGHIIFNDYTTTGDGCVAALQVLAALIASGKPASETLHVFTPFPQVLKNVRFAKGAKDPLSNKKVQQVIKEGEKTLGGKGRVFIRKSGTEPLIRIMVEGESQKIIRKIAGDIASEIEAITK
ncbi:MAG: phosphoglucosamine mutase [Proteobacteria bacterium]|nr:phosphoglucosamine mutase [Pseudomonadota bacterium]